MKVVLRKSAGGLLAPDTDSVSTSEAGVWKDSIPWVWASFKEFRRVALDMPMLEACQVFGFEVPEFRAKFEGICEKPVKDKPGDHLGPNFIGVEAREGANDTDARGD